MEFDFAAGHSLGEWGALYAAGTSVSRLEELAHSVRWRDLASLTLPRMGFLSSEGIARFVARQTGNITFPELCLPLAVVATDLLTGEKIVLRHGSVPQAVRASCSVPQLYSPVEIDGRLLVDGGLVEYLPVTTAYELGAEIVIAVNAASKTPKPERPQNMVQVVLLVIGIVARWNANLAEGNADLVIRPDMTGFGSFELDAGPEMVDVGYEAARQSISELRRLVDQHGSLMNRLRRLIRRP